ncbi:MAG: hypothetical protein Q7R96_02015 [Nanoarchaeota archaeon]|nr:hypothetical protein [Nanoarchaeota archaeon]
MSSITINHELFNELGIDSEELERRFKKMPNPERSLSARLEKDLIIKIQKENPITAESNEKYFRELYQKNVSLCILLHIIARKSEYFDEQITKELYEKQFKESPKIQIMLFNAYLTSDKYDLLRIIHYTRIVRDKRYLTYKCKDKFETEKIVDIDEATAESFIKTVIKSKNKKKNIHVWYILKQDEGIAFFIFRKAKSRKSIPMTYKKGYQFVDYSKPIIIHLRDECKTLEIFSGEIKQSIKYATAIVANYCKDKSTQLTYEQSNQKTTVKDMNYFISEILNNKDEKLELRKLKFKPKEESFDAFMTITKDKDEIKEIINKIEEIFEKKISSENCWEIEVKFDNKLFSLHFMPESDEIIVSYTPKSSDSYISNRFINHLKSRYRLYLNKRVR